MASTIPLEVDFLQTEMCLVNELMQNPTVDNLISTVLNNSKSKLSKESDDLPLLRKVLSDREKDDISAVGVIKRICETALKTEKLFKTGILKLLKQGEVSEIVWTRDQVSCILANLFLGTLDFGTKVLPNRGFYILDWFQQDVSSPMASCCNLYINTLLNYFEDEDRSVSMETVRYRRHVLTQPVSWDKLDIPLITDVRVNIAGIIGDDATDVQVDFANKYVGPGSGGTQEELILGTHPETIPICILSESLLDTEAISMMGARQYGTYSGYGFDTRYEGRYTGEKNWPDHTIIAIDAICYRAESAGESRIQQLDEKDLIRELNKAYVGFQTARGQSLATGHWGCGAFQGDKEIKCLIQLMAASAAGVKMVNFYCFGDREFHAGCEQMLTVIGDKKMRVCDVWNILTTVRPKNPNSMKEKYEPRPYLFKHFDQL